MTTTTRGKELAFSSSSSSFASRSRSSSSSSCHVFLSFRGKDTRWTVVDHLYTALKNAGFCTFRDDDEIQRGESIKVELRRAIEDSMVSIVVFSRTYASSSWCLDELAMILGRRRREDTGHVVLPVFYCVDPSDVRKQKGVYAMAFATHEKRFKFKWGAGKEAKRWKEKVKGWREALGEVADIAGMPLPDRGNRHEAKFIQKIVKAVEDVIRRSRVLNVATYPIGLDSSFAKNISLSLQDEGVEDELRRPRGKEPAFSFFPYASRCSGSYHVFLSFRGEDTRWTFADHLYTALKNAGFRTFRDDDEIQSRENIQVELRRAIEESRVSIVVFSRNYASSNWCLDKLAMILGRRRRGDSAHVVLPVFYGVDPSDVRKQKGVYAEAFARHEERFKFEVGEGEEAKEWREKLKGWREALEEAAGLGGMPLPDGGDRYLIQKIVKVVVTVVEDKIGRPRALNVAPYPIGLDSRAKSINLWLQDGGIDVEIIAICGMGGIGKTTIAKFVYNLNFLKFEGSSFIANIREISEQKNGLIRLQSQLLSDILGRKVKEICNVDEGILKIKEVIGLKRVFIVLDDVDKREQLDAILGMKNWLSQGSKLIITTRHEQLLRDRERWKVHKVEELNHDESLQLFSWYAFGQSRPIDDYLVASQRVVDYCKGLPLAVKILGSSLSGRSLDVWKRELQTLIAIPGLEIFEKLKQSYDSLEDQHDQDLFLDIACFFVGGDKDTSMAILDACGYYALVGIQNLIDRNMLTIDGANKLVMHPLIQEIGREIVRQESFKELGERSRLWNHKDSFSVLNGKMGTKKIRGLVLDVHFLKEDESEWNSFGPNSYSKKQNRFPFSIFSGFPLGIPTKNSIVALEGDAFSGMSNLQFLQISHVQLFGNYENFPKGLRWLHWSHFPLQRIPNDFPLDKLVALEMPYSCLKKVLNGTKCLLLLKILDLSHSYYLSVTPDFSRLPNLERVILKNCTRLVTVAESIGCLERLVFLDFSDCESLRKLPQTFYRLKSLTTLDIRGCSKLGKFSAELGNMNSLAVLLADGTAINRLFSIPVDNLPGMGSKDCVFEGQDSMALKVNNPLFGSRVQLDDSLVHRRSDSLVEVDMQSRSESIIASEDVGKVKKVFAAKSIEIEEDNRQSAFCEQNQAIRVSGGYSRVNQHITRLTSGQDRRVSQANQSECIVHKGNVVDNQTKIMQIGRQNAETVRQGEITGGNEEWPTKSRESRDFAWDELASVEQSRTLAVLSSSDLVSVDPSHPAHEGRDGGVELTRLSRPINVFSGPSQFPMDYEHGGIGLHGVTDGIHVPEPMDPLVGKGFESASWAKLLESSGPRIPQKLEYTPPHGMMDGIPIVKLPEAIIEENTSYWQSTLVGYFVEESLPFPEVRSLAMLLWKRHGLLEVISNNRGFYLFRFDTIEHMVGVFNAGPWYFENRPILLKCWELGMNLSLESHTSVPVWVKIYDVPLEGWSTKGIAVIASGLGRPIYIDPMTEDRCRMGFARVCVEMNVSSSFPKYIFYDQGIDEVTGEPKAVWLPVEYMWVPSVCSHCRVFGHKVENCSKVPHSAPDVPRPSSVVPPKGKVVVGDEERGT